MFPAQTSLIPITVALARFLEVNGSGGLYPYWYLGTTPYKYLTGPVVPNLLVGLKTVFPGFSFFELALILVIIAFFVQALGWGIFVYRLSGRKLIGWWVGVLTLILPWHVFSALGLGETSAVLASALTPWALLAFVWGPVSGFLPASAPQPFSSKIDNPNPGTKSKKGWVRAVGNPSTAATPHKLLSIVLPAVVFAVLLLTNTTASVPAIVGMIIISITNDKFQITKLKWVLAVVLLGWILTLWWYPPDYWLTIWGAPGIGGKNIFGVLSSLADFLRGFLPVIAALLFVFWKVKPRTVFEKFSLGWLVLFGSLTMFRFMADWDFWMDWTAWMGEVEVGVALLIAGSFLGRGPVSGFLPAFAKASAGRPASEKSAALPLEAKRSGVGNPSNRATPTTLSMRSSIWLLVLGIYVIGGWFLAWQNGGFWLPRSEITQTVEYMIPKVLEKQVRPDETVFLSGTAAFWLNSLVDVRQVRGGRDEGSVDLRWREAAWEVREGESASRSIEALKSLGVDFLVVHTDKSGEYYHDFKNPEKFEDSKYFEQEYSDHGDIIYRIK